MGRVYLYLGEEDFLKKEEIERLRISYGEKAIYYSFSPQDKDFNIEEIIRLARTKNLFSPYQIITIKDIEKIFSPQEREILSFYIRNPAEHTELVLVTNLSLKKANSETEWLSSLLKEPNLKIKEFYPLSEGELSRWIIRQVHKRGKNISPLAINFLITKLGNNTSSLVETIERVCLYIKEKKVIEWMDLEPIMGKDISFDVYTMINALFSKRLSQSIKILKNMEELKEKPDKVMGTLIGEWRKLYLAKKLFQQGLDSFQVKKKLNLFYADIFFSNLKRITLDKIEKSLRKLLYIDYAIKAGKVNPFLAIETWFLEFFG